MGEKLKRFFERAKNGQLEIGYSIDYRDYTLIYDEEDDNKIVEIWKDQFIADSSVSKIDSRNFDTWKDEIDSIIDYGCESEEDWAEWSEKYN